MGAASEASVEVGLGADDGDVDAGRCSVWGCGSIEAVGDFMLVGLACHACDRA